MKLMLLGRDPMQDTYGVHHEFFLGMVFSCSNLLYDKAVADYTEAIRLDPTGSHAYYNRGSVYYGYLGEYDKAIWIIPRLLDSTRRMPMRRRISGEAMHTDKRPTRRSNCRLHGGHSPESELCHGVQKPGFGL